MKIHVSPHEIFINYEQRSIDIYHPQLSKHIESKFRPGVYKEDTIVRKILDEYYDWCALKFQQTMLENADMLFVNYLFAYHESSIQLWMRTLANEDLQEKYGIIEDELSMNRRIFKLALEQSCDINYINSSKATRELIRQFDETIEDLLYIGAELYRAGEFLSELRMVPNILIAIVRKDGLFQITRDIHVEAIFEGVFSKMKKDFSKGIVDTEGVVQLKGKIQECFGIDYDFAAYQIMHIKKHHSPQNWQFQTIEPGILVQNLVANGVGQVNAERFYSGLTLTNGNKLPVKDAVYRVNSMDRYFFRPILEITQNGSPRHLIGREKWAESIVVLATNNFQWNKAPAEWKENTCFQDYLEQKSEEHDSLLENEVEKILQENSIYFFRNITSLTDGKTTKTLNIAGVGEIDFIWVDIKRKRIVVADCKYNRARYDMISFSADDTNFRGSYEKKIHGKSQWVDDNKVFVLKYFMHLFPSSDLDTEEYKVEELFIINTPTLYMYLNRVNTVCFFNLVEFMKDNYSHPAIAIYIKSGIKTKIQIKAYPYF
jgi:hypothetical protein